MGPWSSTWPWTSVCAVSPCGGYSDMEGEVPLPLRPLPFLVRQTLPAPNFGGSHFPQHYLAVPTLREGRSCPRSATPMTRWTNTQMREGAGQPGSRGSGSERATQMCPEQPGSRQQGGDRGRLWGLGSQGRTEDRGWSVGLDIPFPLLRKAAPKRDGWPTEVALCGRWRCLLDGGEGSVSCAKVVHKAVRRPGAAARLHGSSVDLCRPPGCGH